MLNFFQGGPLNGHAYDTVTLCTQAGLSLPVTSYKWTPTFVTSERTGEQARVWIHNDNIPGPDSVDPNQPEGSTMARNQNATTEAPDELSDLERTRTNANISRAALATAMGSTTSKVYRIERGGKRTTDEEREAYNVALRELIAATPVPAPTPDASDPS